MSVPLSHWVRLGERMAKAYRVEINIPMLRALRRGVLRWKSECGVCDRPLDEHSEITLNQNGEIIECSNNPKGK